MKINSFLILFILALSCLVGRSWAQDKVTTSPKAELVAGAIARELKSLCPIEQASDKAVFDSCRKGLFQSELLQRIFADGILWGDNEASKDFYQLKLTHFSREIFLGLYLPLFMFDGKYRLDRNLKDHWLQLHLSTSFRNRLAPSEFPYPFWHDSHKWEAYQDANTLLLRIDPVTLQVVAVMRARDSLAGDGRGEKIQAPPFDGKWLWTDAAGKTQPAVTLFDGLFSPDNPFKAALTAHYRELALILREESCVSCHNPSNPSKMSPLILMQTPAHAAGEIRQIIQSIERNEMPLTDWRTKKMLDPVVKENVLRRARVFADLVDQAYLWERCHNNATSCE